MSVPEDGASSGSPGRWRRSAAPLGVVERFIVSEQLGGSQLTLAVSQEIDEIVFVSSFEIRWQLASHVTVIVVDVVLQHYVTSQYNIHVSEDFL
jgi:hypothetical protein